MNDTILQVEHLMMHLAALKRSMMSILRSKEGQLPR